MGIFLHCSSRGSIILKEREGERKRRISHTLESDGMTIMCVRTLSIVEVNYGKMEFRKFQIPVKIPVPGIYAMEKRESTHKNGEEFEALHNSHSLPLSHSLIAVNSLLLLHLTGITQLEKCFTCIPLSYAVSPFSPMHTYLHRSTYLVCRWLTNCQQVATSNVFVIKLTVCWTPVVSEYLRRWHFSSPQLLWAFLQGFPLSVCNPEEEKMSIKWLIDNYTSYIGSSEGVVLESEWMCKWC